LHVGFHGLRAIVEKIHDTFFRDAGYNAVADPKNIIVLAAAFHGIGPATAAKMNRLGIATGADLKSRSLAFLQEPTRDG
jgi:hypothetical protein